MSSPSTDPTSLKRSLWQRRVRDPIVAQLTQGITPEKIALTLAVGTILGIFPVLGTTTLLCFVAGVWLRLNQPMIQVVNQLCWVIHLPFIYFTARWGLRLFGSGAELPGWTDSKRMLLEQPRLFFSEFSHAILYACVVWAILVPFWIAIVYFASLPLLRGIARARIDAVAKAAEESAGDHPVP